MRLTIRNWVIFSFIFCAFSVSAINSASAAEDQVIKVIAKAQAKLDATSSLAMWDEIRQDARGNQYRFTGIRIYHWEGLYVIDEGQAGDFTSMRGRVKTIGSIDVKEVSTSEAHYAGKMVIGKKAYPFSLHLSPSTTFSLYHLKLDVDGPLADRDLDVMSGVKLNLNP